MKNMHKWLLKSGVALALVGTLGAIQSAEAASPGDAIYMGATASSDGKYSFYTTGSAKLMSSTVTAGVDVLKAVQTTTMNNITGRLDELNMGRAAQPAMAAGDSTSWMNLVGMGVWGKISSTNFKNTSPNTHFHGRYTSGTVGFDGISMSAVPGLIGGLAYTYGNGDVKTGYNKGSIEEESHTISPYVTYRMSDLVTINGIFGYGWVRKDTKRTHNSEAFPGGIRTLYSANMTGKARAKRMFGGIYANMNRHIDEWFMGMRLGVNYAEEKQSAFTEDSDNQQFKGNQTVDSQKFRLTNLSARLRGGYVIDNRFMPYVQGGGSYNASQTKIRLTGNQTQPSDTRAMGEYGGGILFFPTAGWKGNVEFVRQQGPSKLKANTFTLELRREF